MHSLFSWPKMLGTCALLAFTAGAVIQEMSPRSDLYQSTDENAAVDLGLSNITYASAQFNYRNYGSFGDINPRVNSAATLHISPRVNAPEIETHIDSGCSPKIETTLDKEAIATIKVHSPCAAFAKISAHHMGLSATARTDATGTGTLYLPLLSTASVIFVDVGTSQMVTQTASTDYLNNIERTVLSWSGKHELQLTHADEASKSLSHMQIIDRSPDQSIGTFDIAMISSTPNSCDDSVQFTLLNAKQNAPITVRDFSVTPEVCDATQTKIQLKSIF